MPRKVHSLVDLCVRVCTEDRRLACRPELLQLSADLVEKLMQQLCRSNRMTEQFLQALTDDPLGCPLELVDLSGCAQNGFMYLLSTWTNLRHIILDRSYSLTDDSVAHLLRSLSESNIPLETLSLGRCKKLGDEAFSLLNHFPSLTRLNINGTKALYATIEIIMGLKNLQDLNVSCCLIGHEAVCRLLVSLPHLHTLNVAQTGFGDRSMAWLQQNHGDFVHEALHSLDISFNVNLTNNGAQNLLKRLPGLSNLILSINANITGDVYKWLADYCPNLVHLNLSGTNVQDDEGEELHRLQNLESVDLSRGSAGDMTATALSKIPCLSNIRMAYTSISNYGLFQFRKLPNIRQLSVSGCSNITDDGIEFLSDSIKTLEIGGYGVTNQSVRHFLRLTSIEYLNLWETSITDYGCEEIMASLRLEKDPRMQSTRGTYILISTQSTAE